MLTAIRGPATRLYILPPKYAEVRPGLCRQLEKTTYTSKVWALAVLAHLQNADWGLPTVWISDRDPKFVRGLKLMFGFDLRMPWNLLYNAFARSDLAPRQDAAECLKVLVAGAASIAHGSTFYTEDVDVVAPSNVLQDICKTSARE
ncbi:hypothetical protein PENPOL_c008G03300 [Penicillium polonicum]|uniref:Uncharacterized protein n=1 Tax=Penicillium polonicum TaxID=60169 RepID=A0A1V6NHS8_PENPO|nr:hypothetical protein PENPOL_c008G03300 [Penicillium polonicum]